jgi:hypothetical protein
VRDHTVLSDLRHASSKLPPEMLGMNDEARIFGEVPRAHKCAATVRTYGRFAGEYRILFSEYLGQSKQTQIGRFFLAGHLAQGGGCNFVSN